MEKVRACTSNLKSKKSKSSCSVVAHFKFQTYKNMSESVSFSWNSRFSAEIEVPLSAADLELPDCFLYQAQYVDF